MISPPVLPPPVKPGDRVGVAALSGPVAPERLEAGLMALAEMGYEPVEAANLRSRGGLFAGGDQERLDAFSELAKDPTVRAIVFARGGHGVLRLLPRIDWPLLERHPRAYVGYSDLTPFLLRVVERLGLVAFHGPMVAAELARGLAEDERTSFVSALAGSVAAEIPLSSEDGKQAVEGPLLGGCLSLLVATLGTPFAPDLAGAILFFEDLYEPPYRLDRMLTHLRLSGNLAALKGVIAGHLTSDGERGYPSPETLHGPFWELAEQFDGPLAWGLPVGHARPNLTLPLGLTCRLDPARRSLVIGPVEVHRTR